MSKKHFKKLLKNVDFSANYGAAGGRTFTLLRDAGYTENQISNKFNGHDNSISWEDLRDIFEFQNRLCYYLSLKLGWLYALIPKFANLVHITILSKSYPLELSILSTEGAKGEYGTYNSSKSIFQER